MWSLENFERREWETSYGWKEKEFRSSGDACQSDPSAIYGRAARSLLFRLRVQGAVAGCKFVARDRDLGEHSVGG